ncbi:VOC family protein [Oceanobacillus sp. CAU 1775]
MDLLKKIDTVCLTIRNAEKASKWYQEILGLNESFIGENYRVLSIGNSEVPLTIEEGIVNNSQNQVYPIFYSENIEEVHMKLIEKEVKVSEIQNDGVNKFIDIYDLDGNKLQICYWK